MSNNSFPLKELSINDVFNGSENVKYEIPIYQRNYAWEKDQISELVNDVRDACKKNKEAYYIGTLVTYDKGDNTFEVIDGQQRLTTLFLLLKYLNVKTANKLTYRARTSSIKALERIDNKDDLSSSELDDGIIDGYSYIDHILKDMDEEFKNYLLYNVRIIHYNVPKDVDLNHYFEVMNSRGEQLEKHEIVKAKLMNVLTNESDKSKFAAIWDACSEMNTYIQTKTGIQAYFENNLKDFKYYDKSFDKLTSDSNSTSTTSKLLDLINSSEKLSGKNPDDNDDSKNSMFQPIIDFPNFLLIVLKITRKGINGFDPNDFILDDKELINEFNKVLDDENTKEEDKQLFAKIFCFNLLKGKYLLDNYVVHHTNGEDTYDHNPWQLRYYNKEEKAQTKNLSNDNVQQDKMVQLLSMFEVSFTARQRKNYLFYVLSHLFEDRNLETYCEFLEDLAKKYFFDIYMKEECLNKINVPMPGEFDKAIIKDNHIDVQICNSNADYSSFCRIYGDGSEKSKGIPLFVFNYLDYQIWKKYAENLAGERLKEESDGRKEFFNKLGCSDFGLDIFNRFYFSRTRRSLEHYYPQANINNDITEDNINCFGNFAMIGNDANSSGSNWSPKTKLDHYLDSSKKVRQVGVASLKFIIMMQMCRDNDEDNNRKDGQEWMFEDIQNHQILMLKILLGQ
jgi:hypothetical protein